METHESIKPVEVEVNISLITFSTPQPIGKAILF